MSQQPIPFGAALPCNVLVEIVTDYLEGVLDEATRAEVEAHLALCRGCAEHHRGRLGRTPADAAVRGTAFGGVTPVRVHPGYA